MQAANEQQRGDEQIKVAERSKLKRGKDGRRKTTEMGQKIEKLQDDYQTTRVAYARKTTEMDQKIKLQDDYQTTRVAYANWLCAVFGFWGRQLTKWGQLRPPPL